MVFQVSVICSQVRLRGRPPNLDYFHFYTAEEKSDHVRLERKCWERGRAQVKTELGKLGHKSIWRQLSLPRDIGNPSTSPALLCSSVLGYQQKCGTCQSSFPPPPPPNQIKCTGFPWTIPLKGGFGGGGGVLLCATGHFPN